MNKQFPKPSNIIEMIEQGLDRSIPSFQEQPLGCLSLNLGAGRKMIGDSLPLDWEHGWIAPAPIPFEDESVSEIFAYHFFEHLTGQQAIDTLRECERVLAVGGTINILVPLAGSIMAYQDLDHKSFWTEETFRILFNNKYYDGSVNHDWRLQVVFQLVVGLTQKNLALVAQIVKA